MVMSKSSGLPTDGLETMVSSTSGRAGSPLGARARDRVLVVDDDPLSVRALLRVLQSGPYDLDGAQTVTDALRLVARREYSVVVTDYKMVGLDGIELCERVWRCTPNTECIIISAYPDIWSDLVARVQTRVFRVFMKPFDVEALRRAVSAACEHRELEGGESGSE